MSESSSPQLTPATDLGTRRTGLRHALAVLRRRWWILVATILVAVGASLARSLTEHKQYTATAALLFQTTNLDQAFFGSPALAPSTDAQQEANTNTQLVSL